MQIVAYIETPEIDGSVNRRYFQKADSFGMWKPFHEAEVHDDRLCTLDSNVLVFDKVNQAKDFLDNYISDDPFHHVASFGYHGITENGNACPPFVTHRAGRDEQEFAANWHKNNIDRRQLAKAEAQLGLPPVAQMHETATIRSCYYDFGEARAICAPWIENQVGDDQTRIEISLQNLETAGWIITDIVPDGWAVTLHLARKRYPTEEYKNNSLTHRSASFTICSFNLMTDEDIRQFKEAC